MITKEEQLKNIDNEIEFMKKAILDLEYYKQFITDMGYNIEDLNSENHKLLFVLNHYKYINVYYASYGYLFAKVINTDNIKNEDNEKNK